MTTIRIAERYDDQGDPIYSITLKQVIGQIMETDTASRNADLDQLAADLGDMTGLSVVNDGGIEGIMLSDAFFNCELVADAAYDYEVMDAAKRFNAELPEPFRSQFTVEWLFADYYERL